jgi:hypothetical protein
VAALCRVAATARFKVRNALARQACLPLNWRSSNGRLCVASAKVALRKTEGLGPLGEDKDRGLWLHSLLAVREDGVGLGVLHARCSARAEADNSGEARFDTFKNTGDYDAADGEARFPKDSYENLRLRFIRTQRDEVDAIEAFGTFIWDIRFKDFQSEYDLARITWDEARHTEIGHRALLAAGYDPFELRNRLTGSTCRGPMEPAFAMAEINLFSEVGVLKTINQLVETARERDDALLAHIADFIRADERTHVRKGQHILKCMTSLGAQELELKTRELFTECLVSLGAVKSSMDVFTVSREDIEQLVGE